MEFRDFGYTTTIPICHWIFWNFFGRWEIQRAFQQAITREILDFYCRNYGDQRNSFHLRAVRAAQKTSSNIFLGNKRKLYHVR
jgi:hypothetical protein